MKNESNEQDRVTLEKMGAHRLAPSSAGLRGRVLGAAHGAWEENMAGLSADEVPWTMPVFRLAASFAIAILLIVFANGVLVGEQSAGRSPSGQVAIEDSLFPEGRGHHSVMSKLAAISAAATADQNAAEDFIRYRRRVRELTPDRLRKEHASRRWSQQAGLRRVICHPQLPHHGSPLHLH
jgi:hypothetical protein